MHQPPRLEVEQKSCTTFRYIIFFLFPNISSFYNDIDNRSLILYLGLISYLLTEPEESILTALAQAGRGAWDMLFDKGTGNLRFGIDGCSSC
ncbi:MAG: hypothetical protein JJW03_07545 [Desulfosarcina sp.]|nr:hypothetical protein [Desulfobacterales bacterium]